MVIKYEKGHMTIMEVAVMLAGVNYPEAPKRLKTIPLSKVKKMIYLSMVISKNNFNFFD